MTVQQVRAAAVRSERATEALRATVRDAHREGATVLELAGAAGVTRQTIYRWVRADR